MYIALIKVFKSKELEDILKQKLFIKYEFIMSYSLLMQFLHALTFFIQKIMFKPQTKYHN